MKKMKMVYSLGACKYQVFKVSKISEIIEACKAVKEFKNQHMFIVKLYNR